MKRLLSILCAISLVSTGTINLISCNYKKPFNNNIESNLKDENQKLKDENQKLKDENQKLKDENQKLKDENQKLKDENQKLKDENQKLKDENQKLKDENQKLKDENQKLKDENQKLKWKIDKNILFINSINSPTKINANNPNEVKEYELIFALKPKVLESIKTIDNSLTENDFILAFKDYFNQFQPRYIDLTISKKITIIIVGKNKTNGQKEFDVFLPAISKN